MSSNNIIPLIYCFSNLLWIFWLHFHINFSIHLLNSTHTNALQDYSRDRSIWRELKFYFIFNFMYFFREKGKEGEREEEKHRLVASRMPPTGALALNRTDDFSVCRPGLNPLSHTSQGENRNFNNIKFSKPRTWHIFLFAQVFLNVFQQWFVDPFCILSATENCGAVGESTQFSAFYLRGTQRVVKISRCRRVLVPALPKARCLQSVKKNAVSTLAGVECQLLNDSCTHPLGVSLRPQSLLLMNHFCRPEIYTE